MVDLHNHILPGVDDGARNLSEALEMARQAVAQGTTILAATPHRFARGNEQRGPAVIEKVERLQRSLDTSGIELEIVPGIEIPMRPDTIDALRRSSLIPLGGTTGRYLLMEPPFDRIPVHAMPLLESLMRMRYIPIIAHPERNGEIQRDITFLEQCAERGMVIQLTAGSILGKFGHVARRSAKEIALRRDWQVIIASDAHETGDRTTGDLRNAMLLVAEWTGDETAAQRMVDDLPRSLLPKPAA